MVRFPLFPIIFLLFCEGVLAVEGAFCWELAGPCGFGFSFCFWVCVFSRGLSVTLGLAICVCMGGRSLAYRLLFGREIIK